MESFYLQTRVSGDVLRHAARDYLLDLIGFALVPVRLCLFRIAWGCDVFPVEQSRFRDAPVSLFGSIASPSGFLLQQSCLAERLVCLGRAGHASHNLGDW